MREVAATGVLHGGLLRLDDKVAFADDLKGIKDGSIVLTVTLATPKAIRRVKLNRYYFGHVLRLICETNGDDVDVLHAFMCARFLTRRVQIVSKVTGEMEERDLVGRSSELDGEDFWDFVLKVRLFAAEFFSVETSDPDPEWRLHRSAAA